MTCSRSDRIGTSCSGAPVTRSFTTAIAYWYSGTGVKPGKNGAPTGRSRPSASMAALASSLGSNQGRVGRGALCLSRKARIPRLPSSGSMTLSAKRCASWASPSASPLSQPKRTASSARANALPRPTRSACSASRTSSGPRRSSSIHAAPARSHRSSRSSRDANADASGPSPRTT